MKRLWMPRARQAAHALYLVIALAGAGWAQNDNTPPPARAANPHIQRALDSPLLRSAGIKFDQLDAAHRQILSDLSDSGLSDALRGVDPKEIRTLSGKTLDEQIRAAGLGDLNEELVFTPLPPCRLVDTRNVGGVFGINEIRNYNLIGPTSYAGYGGYAGSCGIPTDYTGAGLFLRANKVRALAVNVVAVWPWNTGWLRAWPTNLTAPNASIINYGAGQTIANGLVLQTCTASCNFLSNPSCNPCPNGDLSVTAEGAQTQLIIDVVGYYVPANTSGLVGASSEGTSTSNIYLSDTTTCHEITSCSITNGGSSTRGVTVIGVANVAVDHTYDAHDEIGVSLSGTSASCGSSYTDPYTGKFEVHRYHPTGCCMEGAVPVTRRFTLGAGLTGTYYMNAKQVILGGANDWIKNATLQCMLDQ